MASALKLRSQSVSWPPCISSDTAATQMAGVRRKAKHKWKLNSVLFLEVIISSWGQSTPAEHRGEAQLCRNACFQGCQGNAVNKD